MKRKRHTPQEIIAKLREAEVDWGHLGTLEMAGTPEPATLVLFGTGLLGLVGVIRRRELSV